MVQTIVRLPTTFRLPDGLTVQGASPDLLAELLDALSYETRRLGSPIDDVLQPGIGRQQIVDELGAIGLTPPEELITWWGWRNGTRPGIGGNRSLTLHSVEYAVRMWLSEDIGDGNYSWHPSWLLILGPGSYGMAINCSPTSSPPAVRGTEHSAGTGPDDGANQMISLCTPVTWWLLARAKGWTWWDASINGWQTDVQAFPLEWRLTEVSYF